MRRAPQIEAPANDRGLCRGCEPCLLNVAMCCRTPPHRDMEQHMVLALSKSMASNFKQRHYHLTASIAVVGAML